jgi:hypothetical protein
VITNLKTESSRGITGLTDKQAAGMVGGLRLSWIPNSARVHCDGRFSFPTIGAPIIEFNVPNRPALSRKIDNPTVWSFVKAVAQLRTKLFIITESYNHIVYFDRRTLHANLDLPEFSLVPSHLDPITIASEVHLLATQQLPPLLILSRTDRAGQQERKRKKP